MLWTSSKIDTIPEEIVKKIEHEQPGNQVISFRFWNMPVEKQRVIFEVSSLRKANILEEFIINILLLDLNGDLTTPIIARIFGLDEIFINSCISELINKNIIDNESFPIIKLTSFGFDMASKGMIPDKPKAESIEFFMDRKFGVYYTKLLEDDEYGIYPNYEVIEKNKKNVKKYISRNFLLNVSKEMDIDIEDHDKGKMISSFLSVTVVDQKKTLMVEIWLYDVVTEDINCVVWDFSKNMFRPDISDFIKSITNPNKTFLITGNPRNEYIRNIMELFSGFSFGMESTWRKGFGFPIKVYRSEWIDGLIQELILKTKDRILVVIDSTNNGNGSEEILSYLKNISNLGIKVLVICDSDSWIKLFIDENITNLLENKDDKGIPLVCLALSKNIKGNTLVFDNDTFLCDSLNWSSLDNSYQILSHSIYCIQYKEFIREYINEIEMEICEEIKTQIIETAHNSLLISQLNYLFENTSSSYFMDICVDLIQQYINNGEIIALLNVINFIIIKEYSVINPVAVVLAIINDEVLFNCVLPILAYLKDNQRVDYDRICHDNKQLIASRFEDHFDELLNKDYGVQPFIL